MTHTTALIAILCIVSVAACYGGVAGVRALAPRIGMMSVPNERSSHSFPIPLGGGIALVGVPLALLAVFFALRPSVGWGAVTAYGCGSALIAGVSWYDDRRPLTAAGRLGVHVVGACLAIAALGYWHTLYLPVAGHLELGYLGLPITVLWFVGMINAYNFIDGIDGLAGSQAIVAGLGWLALGLWTGQPLVAALGGLLAGSSMGFLIHNWSPARIFMGDAGSAFLGYSFAFLPLLASRGHPLLMFAGVLLVWPVIFDPLFTVVRRLRRQESVLKPHRAFLFHRLVLSGFSHISVATRYTFLSVSGACLAIAWSRGIPGIRTGSLVVAPLLCIALWLFVLYQEQRSNALAEYPHGRPVAIGRQLVTEYMFPRIRRYGLTFARDAIVVVAAFFAAALLRFDGHIPAHVMISLRELAPAAALIFLTALYLFSIHRRTWLYPNVYDLRATIDACLLATAFLALGDLAVQQQHLLSIAVIMLGGLLTLCGLLAVRVWRPLVLVSSRSRNPSERVLIVGAGRAGNLAAGTMLGDHGLGQLPVGFVDDDPAKQHIRLHGIPVCGTLASLTSVIREREVDSILIAMPAASNDVVTPIFSAVAATGIPVRVMSSFSHEVARPEIVLSRPEAPVDGAVVGSR